MIDSLINTLTQSTEFHLLAALLLGFLVALNPCQIAICLSALSSLADRNNDPKAFMEKSVVFAMGRMTLYFALGTALYFVYKVIGVNIIDFYSKDVAQLIETWMPFLVAAFGVFFLIRALTKHHHSDKCHNSGNLIKKNKKSGVFVMGVLLAFLFCPESAVLFFGMMIPLTLVSKFGLLLLLLFTVAAVVPVVAVAYLCKFSMQKTMVWEKRLEDAQYWINLVSSVLLLATSVVLFCIE